MKNALLLFEVLLLSCTAFSQSTSASTGSGSDDSPGRVAVGIKFSSLGGGFEVATPLTRHSNLRGGFTFFSYSRTFTKDGITYDGQVGFRTLEAHYDFFPWAASFHVSGGLLAYLADPVTATPAVAGQSFSLGGHTYYSDTANPISGHGKINVNRVAPTITVGWGNLLPRSAKRWSIPVEVGVAFQGAPNATLNLSGNACVFPASDCRNVATDPMIHSQVVAEQTKINNNLSSFKVYPILSVGFGYKF